MHSLPFSIPCAHMQLPITPLLASSESTPPPTLTSSKAVTTKGQKVPIGNRPKRSTHMFGLQANQLQPSMPTAGPYSAARGACYVKQERIHSNVSPSL